MCDSPDHPSLCGELAKKLYNISVNLLLLLAGAAKVLTGPTTCPSVDDTGDMVTEPVDDDLTTCQFASSWNLTTRLVVQYESFLQRQVIIVGKEVGCTPKSGLGVACLPGCGGLGTCSHRLQVCKSMHSPEIHGHNLVKCTYQCSRPCFSGLVTIFQNRAVCEIYFP